MEAKVNTIKGGEFIIRDTDPKDVFIPEEWNDEQQMKLDKK